MRCRFVVLLAAVLLAGDLALSPAAAQAPAPQPGPYARMLVVQPNPGQDRSFDEGYQRHMEWHQAARNPWTWYGWYFVLGERMGKFAAGSFFHAATDFDHVLRPGEAGLDMLRNVRPYAHFENQAVLERLAGLSAGAPLPDSAPFLAMHTWYVAPGQAQAFEQMLRAHVRSRPADERFSWYRLALGGEAPAYLLLRAAPSFGGAAQLPDWWGPPQPGDVPGVVLRVRSELLQFMPHLSHQPGG
ncbi:hypothetical protein E4L96_17955 [Massilia arenosa]|uniref:Uncharacterized protein n=1 Tax=Zemynaea arenosa TaxID=2561931 RepID=A0A4Y9S2P7_9BURK|nr:hypothetical protein [Massilia arenosa]TFW15636.1 hypothetical protein E4L96_17955 [Massilia arenosa]